MTGSVIQAENLLRRRSWIRRTHRWLGLFAAAFVILLSLTGIALNHSSDWGLDRRFVSWNWLLDLYGFQAPMPGSSFAHAEHRATLLGSHIYLDGKQLPHAVDALTGITSSGSLLVMTTKTEVLVVSSNGDLVEYIDLSGELSGPISRLGMAAGRPVIDSGNGYLIGDADVTLFHPWPAADPAVVAWSVSSKPPDAEVERLQEAYRGRGVTVERVIADMHSGHIVAVAGPLLLDIIGAGLVLLSVSGLVLWTRRRPTNNRRI